MIKVKAINNLNGRQFEASFDSQPQADAWVLKQIQKQSWGKNARQVIKDQDQYDPSLVLSEFEDVDSESGEARIIVSLKQEYTYTVEELTEANSPEVRIKIASEAANFINKYKDYGKTVSGYFSGLVNARGLTKAQKKQLRKNNDVKSVLEELMLGALPDAKEEILALSADNVILFQEDMDKVVQLIDDLMAQ